MCISNNSYEAPRISFEDTILLGLEVLNADGAVEHVLGYYNTVSARAAAAAGNDFGWPVKSTTDDDDFGWHVPPPVTKIGNAMLFAIPAQPGSVNEKSLIAVGKFPRFMQDLKTAVAPSPPVTRSKSMSFSLSADAYEPIVIKGFDGGVYDVVIAPSATAIKPVIDQVDPAKRPQINDKLYGELNLLYPGFTFVLFCFSEEDTARSGCAVIKYKPRTGLEHLLYLPGLDGHNGHVETGEVELNHTLVVGSYRMTGGGRPVHFSDPGFKEAYPFFPNEVLGVIIPKGTMAPQGDFLFKLDEIRQGTFRAKRQLPPGWSGVFGNTGVTAKPHFIASSMGDLDY